MIDLSFVLIIESIVKFSQGERHWMLNMLDNAC